MQLRAGEFELHSASPIDLGSPDVQPLQPVELFDGFESPVVDRRVMQVQCGQPRHSVQLQEAIAGHAAVCQIQVLQVGENLLIFDQARQRFIIDLFAAPLNGDELVFDLPEIFPNPRAKPFDPLHGDISAAAFDSSHDCQSRDIEFHFFANPSAASGMEFGKIERLLVGIVQGGIFSGAAPGIGVRSLRLLAIRLFDVRRRIGGPESQAHHEFRALKRFDLKTSHRVAVVSAFRPLRPPQFGKSDPGNGLLFCKVYPTKCILFLVVCPGDYQQLTAHLPFLLAIGFLT